MLDIVFILYNLKLIYLDWIEIIYIELIFWIIYIYFSRNLENRVSENLRTVKAVWF